MTGRGFGAALALGAVPGADEVESPLGAGPAPGAASVLRAASGALLWFGALGRRRPTARRCTTR
ncbi:hypothetical protein [Streptomyces sp. WAC01526]|uniref:hypothetical protein n=1 Tax=Streptomyces sp. WAC01526 TaxID=2588709 RepID=UPI0011DFA007|nr:hypothetical protein [Streptomyces sp. WAC01526]